MKILIIGGAGYIGSVLTPFLLKKNLDVTVYDSLIYNQNSLFDCCANNKFNFIEGDISNEKLIVPILKKFDVIILLAAIVGAPACNKNKKLTKLINYIAPKKIIENISKKQLLIFPTTNSGYGIGGEAECSETSPLRPISSYGKYKVSIEKIILDKNLGVTLRFATLFGMSPRMRLDLLVNDFVFKAYFDKYIILFEEHFRRNFLHIKDAVNSIYFSIENYNIMKGQPYNVGLSSANLTKLELALRIKKHFSNFVINSSDIANDPDKRDYIVSNKKIEKIGWKPKFSLDDGIIELKKGYSLMRMNNFKNI